MKILLVGAILLSLTGCGMTSTEKADQQRALIEYESCLRAQEEFRVMLIDQLLKQGGTIPDAVFENISPDKDGKIAALESALKNCKSYRP